MEADRCSQIDAPNKSALRVLTPGHQDRFPVMISSKAEIRRSVRALPRLTPPIRQSVSVAPFDDDSAQSLSGFGQRAIDGDGWCWKYSWPLGLPGTRRPRRGPQAYPCARRRSGRLAGCSSSVEKRSSHDTSAIWRSRAQELSRSSSTVAISGPLCGNVSCLMAVCSPFALSKHCGSRSRVRRQIQSLGRGEFIVVDKPEHLVEARHVALDAGDAILIADPPTDVAHGSHRRAHVVIGPDHG
jgi:hypothetical protein